MIGIIGFLFHAIDSNSIIGTYFRFFNNSAGSLIFLYEYNWLIIGLISFKNIENSTFKHILAESNNGNKSIKLIYYFLYIEI